MRYKPHVAFPQLRVALPQQHTLPHMVYSLQVAYLWPRVAYLQYQQPQYMRYLPHVAYPLPRVTYPQKHYMRY